jgi:hypothetical protein
MNRIAKRVKRKDESKYVYRSTFANIPAAHWTTLKEYDEIILSSIIEVITATLSIIKRYDSIPSHFTHYISKLPLENTHMTRIDTPLTIFLEKRISFKFYSEKTQDPCIFIMPERR